jgi:lipoate---protein ligase
MLCILNRSLDAGFNLAAEEYMLKHFSEAVFLLWRCQSSVVIGRNQNLRQEVDVDYADKNHIQLWRRLSGGGAVFHDEGNLNIAFIETNQNPDYSQYARRLQSILQNFGVTTQVDGRNGLYMNGLKLSGSAQFLRKNRLLFHATLLYSTNLTHLKRVLDSPTSDLEDNQVASKRKFVQSVRSPVLNIQEYLNPGWTMDDFINALLVYQLNTVTGSRLYEFSSDELNAINRLKNDTYRPLLMN